MGIFWLQTVGLDQVLFGRWMTPEGEFTGPPAVLNPRVADGRFGAAWDGQRTALLYRGDGGLVFERGDVQCW